MKAKCAACGTYQPTDRMRKRGLNYVCSPPCVAIAALAAAHAPKGSRPSIPRDVRKAVDQRDQRRCRWGDCRRPMEERHHVIYRSQGGPDVLDNLLSLCSAHHRLAHSNKRRYQPALLLVLAEGRRLSWIGVDEALAMLGVAP